MTGTPLFIFDYVQDGFSMLLGDSGVAMTVLVLLVVAVYFRKALGLGSFLANWIGQLVIVLIVLAVLLATGIIPGINIEAFRSTVSTTSEILWSLVELLGELR